MAEENSNAEGAGQADGQQFAIQKVYLKDASFETPHSPEVFRSEWRPEANVELNTGQQQLGEGTYEVVVTVTVTAKLEEQTAYLCEVHQAGIFTITGMDSEMLEGLLGSYCPGLLFPYAREAISDLVTKGGFPPMVLSPVNFDALYAQRKASEQQSQVQH